MNHSFERYQRQILFKEFGKGSQEKLTAAKVLVVGAGGLGSPVLEYLAGAGIGTLGIVDADMVGISNLHRQVIHPENRVGINKAESAAIRLRELNSEILVKTYPFMLSDENAEEIIRGYDFVVICVDNFEARFLINDLCVKLKIPFCNGGIIQMNGQVMTYVPGQGPCYRCIFEDVPEPGSVPSSSEVGVIGPVCGIIGCIQATEVLKYFTGAGNLLTGKILTFDALTMTSRIMKFPKASPECKACGGK